MAILRALLLLLAVGAGNAAAASVLIRNVRVFDGVDLLPGTHDVFVEGQFIAGIEPPAEDGANNTDSVVIDGTDRTLLPGLIDAHAHVMVNDDLGAIERDQDLTDIAINAATAVLPRFLRDGFTSVRDMGGPAFGIMRATASGRVNGPRVFPSGSFITQTSGHGDFRDRGDAGFSSHSQTVGDRSNFDRFGIGGIADGVPEVLRASRVNLRNGATQLKIMAGGGGSSRFDPIDTVQMSEEEMCAAAGAASDWNTYVAAHVFTDRAAERLLRCGNVRTFEHGFFFNDTTLASIANAGGFVVPQMWGLSPELAKNPLVPPAKVPEILALGEKFSDFGQRLLASGVNVAFASDYAGKNADAERSRRYEIYWRTQAFGSNLEVLRQLTSKGGELLRLSGPRFPVQVDGEPARIGVVEPGALADLTLVRGNPLEDMSVIGANPQWFDAPAEWQPVDTIEVVVKDGRVYDFRQGDTTNLDACVGAGTVSPSVHRQQICPSRRAREHVFFGR